MTSTTMEPPAYQAEAKCTTGSVFNYRYVNSRLFPELCSIAKALGVADGDVEDVVQDAFTRFWVSGKAPSEGDINRGSFRKVVNPSLRRYLDAAIQDYLQKPTQEWSMNHFMDIHEPAEPDDLAEQNPDLHIVLHNLGVKDKYREPSPLRVVIDPTAERARDQVVFDRTNEFFRNEVYGALFDLDEKVDWSLLQTKYRNMGRGCNGADFERLIATQPSPGEVRIAEYIAFGTNELSADMILSQPEFYSAMYHVLQNVQFIRPVDHSDDALFVPIRNEMNNHRRWQGDNYVRLRCQLTSGKLSKDKITDLLTDSATREEVGTTKLSRLWQLLPGHRRRKGYNRY